MQSFALKLSTNIKKTYFRFGLLYLNLALYYFNINSYY